MAAPVLQSKFLRSFYVSPVPSFTTDGCMSWIVRLVLEFWGFCINGSNDLVNPGVGSVPVGSFTNFPGGWLTGSNVLLASGSDGSTSIGLPYFTAHSSSPFAPNMVGKWLTTWVSGSTSTDDSIYLITKWLNSSSVVVDPTYGGTVQGKGSAPEFTTRSSINYRVVDFYTAASSYGPYSSGQYIVLQFPNASQVNAGQLKSQFQLSCSHNNSNISSLNIVLSPSGSWTGTTFTDAAGGISGELGPGPGGGGWSSSDWFHNTSGGTGWITLIGGIGFLMCQVGNANGLMSAGPSFFSVEIPTRLYSAVYDPNPICACNFGNLGVFTSAQVGYGFGHRFFPSPYDATTRRWPVQVRGYTGTYWNSEVWGTNTSIQTLNFQRWQLMSNPVQNKFVMTDGVLSMATVNGQVSSAGQFSLARARLRTMRWCAGGYPGNINIGDSPDTWIHVGAGVMLPWDNAIIQYRPLFPGY